MEKEFFWKDKSGRDMNNTFTGKDLKMPAWKEERKTKDWNGKSLANFINTAEVGDEWENAANKITRTK